MFLSPSTKQLTTQQIKAARLHVGAVFIILSSLNGCTEPAIYDQKSSQTTQTLEEPVHSVDKQEKELPFRSPFAGAVVDGKVVLQDIQGPSKDKQYAIVDTMRADREHAEPTLNSGVVTYDTDYGLPEAYLSTKTEAYSGPGKSTPISQPLQDWLNTASSDDSKTVTVFLQEPADLVPPYLAVERAIAKQIIRSEQDEAAFTAELINNQKTIIQREQQKAKLIADKHGAEIISVCSTLPCLAIRVTPKQLITLSKIDLFSTFDQASEPQENYITGSEVSAGSQFNLFVERGFSGYWFRNGQKDGINAAVIEIGGIPDHHFGFDVNNTSLNRIKSKRQCNGKGCYNVSSYNKTISNHATTVAGLLLGDLTNLQFPSITNSLDQVQRSGYARKADLYFWGLSNDNQGWYSTINLFNELYGFEEPLRVLNMSYAFSQNCSGSSTISKLVNRLFERKTLTFFASGNNGHKGGCVIEDPGGAIGAFVVGAHGNNSYKEDENDVRNGFIATYSDRGGMPDAERRTIIDMTAYGSRQLGFLKPNHFGNIGSGTSFSAPTVSAAAVNFIDHYKHICGNLVDYPGTLTSLMLLMGDRQAEEHGKAQLVRGFSNLWGSGRIKMRRLDSTGLDEPWEWQTSISCISNNQNIYFDLWNGDRVPADVDALKVALYFFDRNHENGHMDDIDIYLERSQDRVHWEPVNSSNASYDEKERIFYSDFSGEFFYRVRVHGYRVNSSNSGCGNGTRFYLSWFFEDSDREHWENLKEIDKE